MKNTDKHRTKVNNMPLNLDAWELVCRHLNLKDFFMLSLVSTAFKGEIYNDHHWPRFLALEYKVIGSELLNCSYFIKFPRKNTCELISNNIFQLFEKSRKSIENKSARTEVIDKLMNFYKNDFKDHQIYLRNLLSDNDIKYLIQRKIININYLKKLDAAQLIHLTASYRLVNIVEILKNNYKADSDLDQETVERVVRDIDLIAIKGDNDVALDDLEFLSEEDTHQWGLLGVM